MNNTPYLGYLFLVIPDHLMPWVSTGFHPLLKNKASMTPTPQHFIPNRTKKLPANPFQAKIHIKSSVD